MARFRYVGDPAAGGGGPELIKLHGYVFDKGGKPVEVPDDKVVADIGGKVRGNVVEKLRGNSHFEEVTRGKLDKSGLSSTSPGAPRSAGTGRVSAGDAQLQS